MAFANTTVVVRSGACVGFEHIRSVLEGFRLFDRGSASDEVRLGWMDEIRDIGRRVSALTAVLVAEADEAGSAMRARHTRLEDWMARSGQETAREASSAVWAARGLERRPAVRDATAAGRITVGQAKAIGEALDALPAGLERRQRAEAEQLILTQAQHEPAEKLRTMTELILRQVAPGQIDSRKHERRSSPNAMYGRGAGGGSGSGRRPTDRSTSEAAFRWLLVVGCRTWCRRSPTGATGPRRTRGTGRRCRRPRSNARQTRHPAHSPGHPAMTAPPCHEFATAVRGLERRPAALGQTGTGRRRRLRSSRRRQTGPPTAGREAWGGRSR